jgi:hypothetical protein
VEQAVVSAGRPGPKVATLDKQGLQPSPGKVAHNTCAGRSPTNDQHVKRLSFCHQITSTR